MTKEQLFVILDDYDDTDEINLNEIMRDFYKARQAMIDDIEERQHKSGFYAQQDLIDMYRRER